MTEKIMSLYLAMASIGATVFIGITVKQFCQVFFKKRIGFKFLITLGMIVIPIFAYFGMSWELIKSIILSLIISIIILEVLVYSDELNDKITGEKKSS